MHFCSDCQGEATHFDYTRGAWLCGAHAEREPVEAPPSTRDSLRAELQSWGFSMGFFDRLIPFLCLGGSSSSYRFDTQGGRYTTLEVRSESGDGLCVVRAHFDLSTFSVSVRDYSPATDNEYVTAEFRDDNPSPPNLD
jgi:hypothetical protein